MPKSPTVKSCNLKLKPKCTNTNRVFDQFWRDVDTLPWTFPSCSFMFYLRTGGRTRPIARKIFLVPKYTKLDQARLDLTCLCKGNTDIYPLTGTWWANLSGGETLWFRFGVRSLENLKLPTLSTLQYAVVKQRLPKALSSVADLRSPMYKKKVRKAVNYPGKRGRRRTKYLVENQHQRSCTPAKDNSIQGARPS